MIYKLIYNKNIPLCTLTFDDQSVCEFHINPINEITIFKLDKSLLTINHIRISDQKLRSLFLLARSD